MLTSGFRKKLLRFKEESLEKASTDLSRRTT